MAVFTERGMELWHVPGMAVTVVSALELFGDSFSRVPPTP
jgi:hypothetical protein